MLKGLLIVDLDNCIKVGDSCAMDLISQLINGLYIVLPADVSQQYVAAKNAYLAHVFRQDAINFLLAK